MKLKLLVLSLLLLPFLSFAQHCGSLMRPVSIQERVNEATKVIEGEIISSESFWDIGRKHIYTVHTVNVFKKIKGDNATTIKVVTSGGSVGDVSLTVSSAASLRVGDLGVFFLKSFRGNLMQSGSLYEMVGAAQGILKYSKFKDEASDVFTKYTSIENDVYSKLQQATRRSFQTIQQRPVRTVSQNRATTPTISGFSPVNATAGTETVLTISGTNFGTTQGTVGFANADDGGSTFTTPLTTQILSWSDTQITVQIPTKAGTGGIIVQNASGSNSATTSVALNIAYAHLSPSSTGYPYSMINDDGNGGYTFTYHTDFNTSTAKSYFNDAFEVWNCESDLNFSFASSATTTDVASFDNINIVRFDNGNELPTGVLGQVASYASSCSASGKGLVFEMDVTWDDGANFYYGTGNPSASQIDFKSVALHELGHAHSLGHVNDLSNVMGYALGAGDNKYYLTQDNIDGALNAMSISSQSPGCNGATPMTTQVLCCDDLVFTTQPVITGGCENETFTFSGAATGHSSVKWQESTDDGTNWNDISNGTNYSGATTTTLTVINAPASFDTYQYRLQLNNECTSLTSNEVALVVQELPVVTVTEQQPECLGDDGALELTFNNSSYQSQIEFSIDDGSTYAHSFNDNSGSGSITLAPGTYNLWARWGNNACPTDLGEFILNEGASPSIDSQPADTTVEPGNGIAQFTITASAYDTIIWEESTNNGTSWTTLTNDTTYSGTTTETLTITNISFGTRQYRATLENFCGYTVTSDTATLSAFSYTAIADNNFESALDALGYDDISGDNQVPTQLISSITSLDVSNENISSLSGIEDFVALETLNYNDNSVTSIDISALTALKTLSAESNGISTLDLSTYSGLEYIHLEGNSLSTIDVSNQTALKTLKLDDNGLTSLDVSSNTGLILLKLDDNSLTTLDLSNNTALEELYISGNTFSTLDVSANTALTELYASNSALTSLDLSNTPLLTTIQLDTNSLTSLNLQNGSNAIITSIALTNNPDLGCVLVDSYAYAETNFTTIDSATSFSEVSCTALTAIPDDAFKFYLGNIGLDDPSIQYAVPTYLIENVESLSVSGLGAIADITGIEDFKALEILYIDDTDIVNVDLSSNILLRELTIRVSEIETIDVSMLSNLEKIRLDGNFLQNLDLSANTNLTEVNVNDNPGFSALNIQNGTNSNITSFISTNCPNLTCIQVDNVAYSNTNWTNIDNASSFSSTYCIYTAIPNANFEAALNALGYDDVSGDGQVPTALIEGVTSLQINNNTITDVTGIEDFVALTDLDLSQIGLLSIDVSNNTVLEHLNLSQNSTLAVLNTSNNTELQTVNVSNCAITALDFSLNTKLTSVEVQNNALLDLNIKNGFNAAITSINLTGNSNLECALVDNVTYSTTNWTNKDAQTNYNSVTCARYAAVPDSNFEAALDALGYDDISNDGQVPLALIDDITVLDLNRKDIVDLTGIEFFTSLQDLNLHRNDIITADFTNNTALTDLDISTNLTLTSINVSTLNNLEVLDLGDNVLTALDVTNSPLLITLDINKNSITSLDLSQNTALVTANISNNAISNLNLGTLPNLLDFYSSYNSITGIDVSGSPLLKNFGAGNNALTSLNIKNGNNTSITYYSSTNNPGLDCVVVDDVTYSDANWTNIDAQTNFSNQFCVYTDIPDTAFETVLNTLGYDDVLGDNKVPTNLIENLTSLDISDNTTITDITGIEDFAALTNLDASNCGLTTVDLSSNTLLGTLNLSRNAITSLDTAALTNLLELYVENTSLVNLDVSSNTMLTHFSAVFSISLETLNFKNGNNTAITYFQTTDTNSLTCIFVEDASYSTTNWTDIYTGNSFTDSDYCDYTAIPDANFEAALDALGYDDISGDAKVPTALIEVVTSLNVSSKSISDLTGIEDFTALTFLNIVSNNLTSIDISNNVLLESLLVSNNALTMLDLTNQTVLTRLQASNTNVTTLDFSSNLLIDDLNIQNNLNLNAIDISNLSNLELFSITDTNITSLDVSNNNLLVEVYASRSPITSLNLSNLTALEYFDCIDCNLEDLDIKNGTNTSIQYFDVTGNPNLTCILVDNATYSANNWTDIDATASFSDTYCDYTAIPDANFETALNTLGYDDIANDGKVPTALIEVVTSLVISNENISDLTGIEDFAALTELYANSNNLTSIDISNNVLLETLRLDNNAFTAVDVTALTQLKLLRLSNTAITNIDLSNNVLLDELYIEDISTLTSIDVSSNTALTYIDASGSGLTTLDISTLANLTQLDVVNNQLSNIDVSNNLLLNELYLEGNTITALNLSHLSNLQYFECVSCGLESLDMANGNNTNVGYFDVTNNPDLTCIRVDDAAYSTTNWTDVDATASFTDAYCEYTAIPDANFEAALNTLGYDDILGDAQVPTQLIETLTLLDVSSQSIADLTGIEAFVALETLQVQYNNLTSLDLSANVALTSVACRNNSLATLIVDNSPNLTQIFAQYNAITALDVSNNTNLETLAARNNQLTSIDLSNNLALESLNIRNNSLVSIDLSVNTNITLVNLINNNLTSLNVKNGANVNITTFNTNGNSTLECVLVDDATYSTTNWTSIDTETSFSDVSCFTEYTAIPDANFEAALETLGYDDISGDSQVPTALIEVVTSLAVNNENISSLTGIEDFTALVNLDASNNTLTSIDLSQNLLLEQVLVQDNTLTALDVSALTALDHLNMSNNSISSIDLTANILLEKYIAGTNNLSAIDLTTNSALTELSLSENSLTALDLTNNTAIAYLDVDNNAITSLDLSGLTALEEVNVSENNLLELNVQNGNNTDIITFIATDNNLSCILVDDVTYSTTNWTNIDAGTSFNATACTIAYTLIPDANFEARLGTLGYDDIASDGKVPTAYIENITSLDVSNQGVSDITGIEDFADLEILNVSFSNISTLDISGNTTIQELDANNANVATLNVSNTTALRVLTTYNNSLSSFNIDNATALEELYTQESGLSSLTFLNNNSLRILKLNSTQMTTLDISSLIALEELEIYSQNNLTNLDVSANTALRKLTAYVTNFPSLDFSGNTNIEEIIVYNNSSLTNIDISGCTSLTKLEAYSTNLDTFNSSNATALEYLDIDASVLDEIDLSQLTSLKTFIGGGTNIEEFNFSQNTALETVEISAGPTTAINLKNGNNNNITSILISGANICLAVDDVSYSTNNWTNVTGVNYTADYCLYTQIPDSNFESALETLGYDDISGDGQVPTALISGVTSLSVTYESISDLTGIEDFTALTVLTASNNDLSTVDISNNTNLESLSVESNSLTTIDVSALTNLQTLRVGRNDITTLDLSNNTGLLTLHVNNNDNMSVLDLSNNTLLYRLDISYCNFSDFDMSGLVNMDELTVDSNPLTSLDLSALTGLYLLEASGTDLTYLNLRNGNNSNVVFISLTNNDDLTCILVDDATYSANNWSLVDSGVSFSETYCRYTQIPDAQFEAQLASYDDIPNDGQVPTANIETIETLDIADEGIADLTGIEDFVALKDLDAYENLYTTVDLSNNTAIEILDLSNCPLTALNLDGLVNLEILNLVNNSLTSLNLTTNTGLTSLISTGNTIVSQDLRTNVLLTEVVISSGSIESINLKNGNNTSITSHSFYGTASLCISVDDASYSATNWTNAQSTSIYTDDYCRYTTIVDTNFEAALEALGYDDITNDGQVPTVLIENVTTLNVDSENIADLTGIEDFTALTILSARSNQLTSINVNSNTQLLELDLALNADLDALDLSTNNILEDLDVWNCDLSTIDLSNLTALKFLNVDGNALTTLDFSNNSLLGSVSISHNPLIGTLDVSMLSSLTIFQATDTDLEGINLQNGNNSNMSFINLLINDDLSCVLVDDADYSTTNWTLVESGTSFNEVSCSATDFTLAIKVYLQGALLNPNTGEESLMRDDLRVANLLPTTSPYSDGLTCDASVFTTTGDNAIVDWIWVELRDENDNSLSSYGRSALLQRDGDIVDVDGTSTMNYSTINDTYYVAVKHRNHLGIMSVIPFTFNSNYSLNFTLSNSVITYGSNAQTTFGMPTGVMAMWAGDTNGDGIVQYSGGNSDVPSILSEVLNEPGNFLNFPTYNFSEYSTFDVNMNANIQYSGGEPDTPYILQNVFEHPGNFLNFNTYQITEQLP